MTLIKSISGMRGTIGGKPGEALTPLDLLEFASAFAVMLKSERTQPTVVIGRDGRDSGGAIQNLIIGVLQLSGCHVVNLGLTTTPTVEMAVPFHDAQGGIILTASHNPAQWNALKFLNAKGEFISAEDGRNLLSIITDKTFDYVQHDEIGSLREDTEAIDRHVGEILNLPYINVQAVKKKGFKVVVDAINSTGALAIPVLLEALGVQYTIINEQINGKFQHNPEPLPANLQTLQDEVKSQKANLGIAVDPDVDRLAFFGPDGVYFGEEYTLVACADHVLSTKKGPTVSNMSSTKALTDLSQRYGVKHFQSAVGEVNVVEMMKDENAVIGGEGNGGVILPDLHYGRDALVGIALVLSLLAERNIDLNGLKKTYTDYVMIKDKMPINANTDPDQILESIKEKFISSYEVSTVDGVKVFFDNGWVHIRKSNTEPIIRIYAEGLTLTQAREYVEKISRAINETN